MSFPRYPKYKACGVEWLGEVPAHWEVLPMKYLVSMRSGGTPSKENPAYWDGGVPWASSKDLKQPELHDTEDHITQRAIDEGAADLVPIGSLLVVVRGMILAHSFPVAKVMVPMAINQDLKAVRPMDRLSEAFLAWLLRGSVAETLRRLDEAAHGTKVLRLDSWTAMRLPVPPDHEQLAIAAFLVRETAKIDALVAEQQRLIELLKEKRQAVISHAVTKGLDPNAKMKPSGIEWLGDVPADWELHRIGRLFQEASDPGSDDLPVLSVSIHDGVSDDELGDDDLERKVTRSEDRTKYKRVRPRDLVYNMMRAWQGGFGTVAVDGMVSPAYVVARPRDGVPTWLVEQQLRTPTAVQEMRRHSRGVTDFRLRLYWEEFKTMVVPLPPDREVAAIEGFLQREEEAAASLVAEAERAITLLQERRTALISAAVTGQVDVRSATSQPWS